MDLLKDVRFSNIEFGKPVINSLWQNVLFNYNDTFFSMIYEGWELIRNPLYIIIKYYEHFLQYSYINKKFFYINNGNITLFSNGENYINGLFKIIFIDGNYLISYDNNVFITINSNNDISFGKFRFEISNNYVRAIYYNDLLYITFHKLSNELHYNIAFKTDTGLVTYVKNKKLFINFNYNILPLIFGTFVFNGNKLKIYISDLLNEVLTYKLNKNNKYELTNIVYFIGEEDKVNQNVFNSLKSFTFDADINLFTNIKYISKKIKDFKVLLYNIT